METDKPHLNEQYFVDKAIDKACLVLERIDQRQTNEQGEKNEDKHISAAPLSPMRTPIPKRSGYGKGSFLEIIPLVPQQDRDNIRKFYCDVFGGKIMKADPERHFVLLEETSLSGFFMRMSLMRASSYGGGYTNSGLSQHHSLARKCRTCVSLNRIQVWKGR